jgi:hypothetical protein
LLKLSTSSLALGALALTLLACGGSGGGTASDTERDRSYRAWNLLSSQAVADFQIDNMTLETINTPTTTASGNDIASDTVGTRSKFYRRGSRVMMRVQRANNEVTFFSGDVTQTSADRQLMTAFGPGTNGSVNHVINIPFEARGTFSNSVTLANLIAPGTTNGPAGIALYVVPVNASVNGASPRINDVRYDLTNPFNMRKYVNLNTSGDQDVVVTNLANGQQVTRFTWNFQARQHLFVVLATNSSNAIKVGTYAEVYGD